MLRSRASIVNSSILKKISVNLKKKQDVMTLTLTSTAFQEDTVIDTKYTCDGQDLSPPLTWSGVPKGTVSFVMICDDPDAPMGTWDHWLLFNLPSHVCELEKSIQTLPEGTQEGKNSWGKIGYGGPCPPDRIHRYYFKLYALDDTLDLPTGADKSQIKTAMEGHILAQAELMGRYDRPGR